MFRIFRPVLSLGILSDRNEICLFIYFRSRTQTIYIYIYIESYCTGPILIIPIFKYYFSIWLLYFNIEFYFVDLLVLRLFFYIS